MPPTLFLDVSRGGSAASILGALVDLGVAPSPILHALADLGLPAHLRIEDAGEGQTVTSEPGEAPVPAKGLADAVARTDLPRSAAVLAQHALERLAQATRPRVEGPCAFQHMLDAGVVLCVCGAAMAVRALEPDKVLVSRVGVDAEPAEAIVELLGDVADALEFGAPSSVTEDAAAFLTALVTHGGWGVPEPEWRGPVARGRSGGARVALGDA